MFAAAAASLAIRRGVITARQPDWSAPSASERWFDAGHPAPNDASLAAAEHALALARDSGSAGGLLVLLSGGASAMVAAPAAGLSLRDKVETSRLLMSAGAPIDELNCVRKHLSRIKGGRLAAIARRTSTLALSDVHGPLPDDPSVIASGPTVPDPSTFRDALDVIHSRRITAPAGVVAHLERGARGELEETIKPGDPRLHDATYTIIGNRRTAMDGARREAEARAYRVVVLEAATQGEARDAGRKFVTAAARAAKAADRPLCVIASGETTVTVAGEGSGGRNQEFALGAVSELGAAAGEVTLASAGTDGIDGPTDAAGAIVDTTTLHRAAHIGVDPSRALARNDAYHFFAPLDDLIRWGPTGTNVGDLHVVLFG